MARALDSKLSRGLIWHTQGSGKTYTMIKAAEMLFKAPEAEKPTVLLMIDRNELEDQMLKNLAAVGMGNVAHADRIAELNRLLTRRADYRGIIVTTIHKFRDMPADINTRTNIYVLIDEAHRTTGGDLGNYLDGRACRTRRSSALPARRWTRRSTARGRSRPLAVRTTKAISTSIP